MRCRCCDKLLTDSESKARYPKNRSEFIDFCNVCRYKSNYYIDDEEVINKEDIHIDYG
jgi:hypothetical protein